MKFLSAKTIFIEKSYLKEVRDSICFKWINPQKAEKLKESIQDALRNIDRSEAVDIIKIYTHLKIFRNLLPENCSHEWLHQFLYDMYRENKIKITHESVRIKTEVQMALMQQWPGALVDKFHKVNSCIFIPKYFGKDILIDGGYRALDSNLMIFATTVP